MRETMKSLKARLESMDTTTRAANARLYEQQQETAKANTRVIELERTNQDLQSQLDIKESALIEVERYISVLGNEGIIKDTHRKAIGQTIDFARMRY